MRNTTATQDIYRTHFTQLAQQLASNGSAWPQGVRQAAFSRFTAIGFPSTRQEAWKHTNVAALAKIPFTLAGHERAARLDDVLTRTICGQMTGPRLVFVNGHYAPDLSALQPLPEGMIVGSLAQAISTNRRSVELYLAGYASFQNHAFVALNTAFMQDGAFIHIPPGIIVSAPIHLQFVSTAPEQATVSYPRNLILVDRGSQATVVESYVGGAHEVYFTNAVTEVVAGEHAVINHYRLQQESTAAFHMATLQVHQDRNSHVISHAIALGGALARNEVTAVLDGAGSECTLNGLFMVAGQQHVDNQTRIEHVQPYCSSRELYKGVLDGKGRGVFNGTVYVHKDAQQSKAQQTNKNLLLSPDAWINTKPQLEIYNNDVQCGHGSTIGRLDEEALFYLRCRGIALEQARSLLTYAFASEMLSQITIEPMQTALHETLHTWLLPRQSGSKETL
jgi:Fe-S cluster assembly protein SufD